MKSRRDLFKFFGAGALIVPLIGSKPDDSNIAQLIETPKLKPVELFSRIPEPINLENLGSATLLLSMKDGTTHRLNISKPETWGTVEISSSTIEISFAGFAGRYTSPASSYASITGKFRL